MILLFASEIGNMKLKVLDVSENALKELPLSLRLMETLTALNIDRNPIEFPPEAVCITFHCVTLNLNYR